MRYILFILMFSSGLFAQGIEPNSLQPTPYQGGILKGVTPYVDPFSGETHYIYQHDTIVFNPDSIYVKTATGHDPDTIYLRDGTGFALLPKSGGGGGGGGTVTSVGLATGTTGTDVNVTGSPITTSGTFTLNIPTASATNTGKLNSSDWTTFNNKVGGSGTATRVAFWDASNSLSSNSLLYWNNVNSRLGVGTDAPAVRMHIQGIGYTDHLRLQGSGGGAGMSFNGGTTTEYLWFADSGGIFGFGGAPQGTNKKMHIQGGVTIGIGNRQLPINTTNGLWVEGNIGVNQSPLADHAMNYNTTNAIKLPLGTTAQRPVGVTGSFRLNTSSARLEYKYVSDWYQVLASSSDILPGSIIFGDQNGNPTQDNPNLFWDRLNLRMGVGTNTPTSSLDVRGGGIVARVQNTSFAPAFEVANGSGVGTGMRFTHQTTSNNLWFNQGTFNLGGSGAFVTNKKLHIDGGVTIGSTYDGTSIDANSLNVEGSLTVNNRTGTAVQGLGRDGNGKIVDLGYLPTAGMTNWNLGINNGSYTSVTNGNNVSFNAGSNVTLSKSGNTITMNATNPQTWALIGSDVINWGATGSSNSGRYVGIGTLSPLSVFHVNGNSTLAGVLYNSSNSAGSSGQVLTSQGSGTPWTWTTISSTDDQNLSYGTKSGNRIPLDIQDGVGVNIDQGEGVVIDRTSSNVITFHNVTSHFASLYNTGNVLSNAFNTSFNEVPFNSLENNVITGSTAGNSITIATTGKYEISFYGTVNFGQIGDEVNSFDISVYRNSSDIGLRATHRGRNFDTSTDNRTPYSRSFVMSLTAGDVLECVYKRVLGAATEINIYNANFTVKRLE